MWTLKMLYASLPKREIEQFIGAACPSSFGAMYDSLKENLRQRVSGVFADYGVKCMLDMLVMQGVVPQWMLSRWPTDCPGYRGSQVALFPGLHFTDYRRAL